MAGATRSKPAKPKKPGAKKKPVDGGDSSSVKKPKKKPVKKTTKVVRKLVKKATSGKRAKKATKKSAVKAVRKLVKKVAAVVVAEPSKKTKTPQQQPAARGEEGWFWVSALYRLTPVGAATLPPERSNQWERRVFVIRAARGDERRAARRVAKQHETRHGVPKGEKAMWRLQEIEAFAQLFDERIENGTEVYWQFFTRT